MKGEGCLDCWLCVTNQRNWRVVVSRGIWGVSERFRRSIELVKPGDKLVFYLVQEKHEGELVPSRVVGVMSVVSEPFVDKRKIFKPAGSAGEEIFPYRVRVKKELIPKGWVEFKPLVDKLKFIKNKQYWTGALRRAMVKIPKEDYELLVQELKKVS